MVNTIDSLEKLVIALFNGTIADSVRPYDVHRFSHNTCVTDERQTDDIVRTA